MFHLITRFHLLLLTVLAAMTGVAYLRVPADFAYPAMWGRGGPDWLWPRDLALLGAPILAVLVLLAFLALGLLLTKNRLLQSRHIIEPGITVVLTVIASVQMGLLLIGVGSDLNLIRMTGYGLAALLVVLGLVIGEAERNSYAGLRMPWPVPGDRAWRLVHVTTGLAFALAGSGLAIMTWLDADLALLLAAFATAILGPVIVAGLATLFASRLG